MTTVSKCYCGKAEKELRCGEGEEKVSIVREDGREEKWTGRFQCENECNQYVSS